MDQIPIGYTHNRIWTESVNVACSLYMPNLIFLNTRLVFETETVAHYNTNKI